MASQTSFAEAVIKPIATVAMIVAAGADCSAGKALFLILSDCLFVCS